MDALIGGVVALILGIVSEALLHPVIPWTYMPGTHFVMIGLGIGVALLERQRPREGRIVYNVALVGVLVWFWGAWQNISMLAPALYMASCQLTRWGLAFAAREE